MEHNRIQPTLQGIMENLNQEVPQLYIEGLKEFLLRLKQFIQEPIDQHTLLYGIDGKFYAPTIKINNSFETNVHGLFLVGDCPASLIPYLKLLQVVCMLESTYLTFNFYH